MAYTFDFIPNPLNRTSIADGRMLQDGVIQPLSDRDNILLTAGNAVKTDIDSVNQLVEDNYSKWDPSQISGFSAVQIENTYDNTSAVIYGKPNMRSSVESVSIEQHVSQCIL